MAEAACCTCASLLSNINPEYDEKTEKPVAQDRRLNCCGRVICGKCITKNTRFATYCPFCQISTGPSALPQSLYEPPAYSPPPSPRLTHATLAHPSDNELPPTYSSIAPIHPPTADSKPPIPSPDDAPDILHFLHPTDTLASLSLAYNTPVSALRRTNGLFSDHLLAARRTILIPGEYYKGGVSLSSKPVEGEEEEIKRGKIRRWMVACKVADIPLSYRYDVALLYLQQADYDLDRAIAAYQEDEKWEKEHPMESNVKGKDKSQKSGKRKLGGFGMTGQLS